MKATLVSLILLCSAATISARDINIPFANVTCITSVEVVSKYSVEFIHPSTKKKTVAPICMADYRKLMKATFDRNYTARCTYNGKNVKVILVKR